MALAIFDLDNTLLNGDSDHAWGEFLISRGVVDAATFKQQNDQFYADYKRGELDILAYMRFALRPLRPFSRQQLNEMHADFMSSVIKPMFQPKAGQLLKQHRKQGDFLLIITATNLFVTEPIARAMGVDDILASTPELVDDHYTGEIVGTPCYQDGKVVRLQQWLKETDHTLEGSYFYSDSLNDLPLLSLVDYPIAVDPDDRLKATALEKGWPVISLRD